MDDRLTQVLNNHIARMRQAVELMRTGRVRTHEDGKDTTEQSISDNLVWIAELEEVLNRHEMRGNA
jgi:hypothetical protein